MKISLLIEDREDREKMVVALASNGYKVWIEEIPDDKKHSIFSSSVYYVCFKLKDKSEYSGT